MKLPKEVPCTSDRGYDRCLHTSPRGTHAVYVHGAVHRDDACCWCEKTFCWNKKVGDEVKHGPYRPRNERIGGISETGKGDGETS